VNSRPSIELILVVSMRVYSRESVVRDPRWHGLVVDSSTAQ
jgi:hypothetical protein